MERIDIDEVQTNKRIDHIKDLLPVGLATLALSAGMAANEEAVAQPYSTDPTAHAADNSNWRQSSCKGEDINTVVCYRTKPQVARYCAMVASAPPDFASSHYENGSKSNYRVNFTLGNIAGCKPAGIRKISYFQEKRAGTDGDFERNSKITTVKTDNKFKVNKILKAPYSCDTDGDGTSVRRVVKVTWLPKPGFGPQKSYTFNGGSSKVC